MLKDFRVFIKATTFYKKCSELKLPHHLRDQILRASSSVALNIAEGSGKRGKVKQRFYKIAYASVKECQAILILSQNETTDLYKLSDVFGGMLYSLSYRTKAP